MITLLFVCFGFGAQPALLRADFRLCSLGSLLEARGTIDIEIVPQAYGDRSQVGICKANVLPAVPIAPDSSANFTTSKRRAELLTQIYGTKFGCHRHSQPSLEPLNNLYLEGTP